MPTVAQFIAWFRREDSMPDAETALGIIWGSLEEVKARTQAQMASLAAAITTHEQAIADLRDQALALKEAEQAAWDAQAQFAAIKRALGLE